MTATDINQQIKIEFITFAWYVHSMVGVMWIELCLENKSDRSYFRWFGLFNIPDIYLAAIKQKRTKQKWTRYHLAITFNTLAYSSNHFIASICNYHGDEKNKNAETATHLAIWRDMRLSMNTQIVQIMNILSVGFTKSHKHRVAREMLTLHDGKFSKANQIQACF